MDPCPIKVSISNAIRAEHVEAWAVLHQSNCRFWDDMNGIVTEEIRVHETYFSLESFRDRGTRIVI